MTSKFACNQQGQWLYPLVKRRSLNPKPMNVNPDIPDAFISSNGLFNSYYALHKELLTRVTKIECASDMSIIEYIANGFGSIKGRLIGKPQSIHGSIWTVKDVCNFELTPANGKVKYDVILEQPVKPVGRSLNPSKELQQKINEIHLEEIFDRSMRRDKNNPITPAEYCKRFNMGPVDFVEHYPNYLQKSKYLNHKHK